ncbi:MAG: cobalamin biosynthesis protein CbiM [Hydrogenophilales bacterium CG03_land_8_20_14_0_80_62_28]|nr:energy-coupling factor ABC transporter permease [Betaproteobacteria bacterium]OIO79336.1 MAG: cobalamin biosynthesis protein CbiM [Hydrogenophilaceae bacterium CG1_02_62_390]PIV21782.1 MAG: cobalamin biosynthesis protein CbiM [Hydrogenophilales bacterium CG03_land_8_20_14_0_80_62_28]PIW37677.1 MAG: cobalamin biosynthesis protein CbiM [Hydrogenophilales bacterium CG15_BIG_FIL_POST_REV_8_21_14_020_62_31]PIW72924.1 MAG: cobalamin biosynthesis protein CbiM [Hydrogenophilales bacterium CG12_big_f
MHIEPGYIAQAKIMLANTSALGVLAYYAKDLIARPADILRTLLAAVFFSLFMQAFHMNIGPSELHFVGAMAIYLTLGFIPTLFGFALGLLLQGLLFDTADLVHLGVNSLSLIVPLITVHYTLGRKLSDTMTGRRINWRTILKLDASYYGGVTAMVGFWLLVSDVATPFSAWAAFASSYLAIVAIEPLFTYALVRLLKRHENTPLVNTCFTVKSLKLAD